MHDKLTDEQILAYVEELQMKVAYQENHIEVLNQALASQQKQLDSLQFTLGHVVDRVKQFQVSNMATEAEETPPPHY